MSDPAILSRLRASLSGLYEIEREVGRGGMATVYMARDPKHDRRVAIKVLHPEFSESLTADRFLREIRIAAGLHHRGILPVFDSGEAEGLLYYVMPYVEGESLRERLEREKQLPLEEALRIAGELAAALEHAHGQGVVHRDVKPENVLFEREQPLLADFGVARAAPEAGAEKLTRTGVSVGTPAYMSPEQGAGGEVDGRSDVYALGCVLYEMLGGEPPFTGPSSQAVLARHAMAPVPDVRTLRPTVPEGVVGALEKALAKVPADRYGSAAAFAEALEKGEAPRAGPRGERPRSRKLTMGLPALALVAAVLGFGIWRTGRSAVPAAAAKMAILPLVPAVEGDSALADLGKGLAVLLAHNLNGVGEIQTEPGISMLPAAGGRVLDVDEAAELAGGRFGASSVVTGSLVRSGERVQAVVQLHTADSVVSFLAEATATAPEDSVTDLADVLTRELLAQIWRKGRAPSPQVTAALKTDSLKALKKFLEGELLYAAESPGDAVGPYLEAFRIDSTFWLAAAMYATSWEWVRHTGPNEPDADPQVLAALRDHLDELPELQRSWIRTAPWRFGYGPDEFDPDLSWVDLFDGYAKLSREHGDFWPILADFGDAVLHHGTPFGHPLSEAAEAFEQALDLNPVLRGSYIPGHIGLTHPSDDFSWRELVRLAQALPPDRWVDSVGFQYGFGLFCGSLLDDTTDRTLADSMRGVIRERGLRTWLERVESPNGPDALLYPFVVRFPAAGFGMPRCLVEYLEGWPEAMPDARARAWSRLAIGTGWAGRGAWDSAFAHLREAVRGEDPSAAIAAYRLAVAGASLGFLEPESVRELRGRVERAIEASPGEVDPDERYLRIELAWFDGMLAAAEGDLAGLREARDRIAPEGDWISAKFRRSLSAFALDLEGNRSAAADSLYRVETGIGRGGEPDLWTSSIYEEVPVLRPVNRLILHRWLLAEGDTARAERLLYWHESVHPPAMKASLFAEGPAYLELGRIHDAWDRPEAAREFYLMFLRTDPIDDYAAWAEEARAAVTRLNGELGPRPEPARATEEA